MSTLGLLAQATGGELRRGGETRIDRIVVDSRLAGPGALFVAVRGSAADGHDWIATALEAGCAGVVTDAAWSGAPDCAWLVVPDTRPAPALLARALHGAPDIALRVAGVTGTNGKTTTAFLLREVLASEGGGCGLLGTIRYETGRSSRPASLTTPGGPDLYGALVEMRDSGLGGVALEVSSHALDQGRTAGLELDVAVLTNLSRDHLDYHGSLEAYLAAKLRILDLLDGAERAKPVGAVALNADDPAFAEVRPRGVRVVRWSTGWRGIVDATADVRLLAAELEPDGTVLELDVAGHRGRLHSALVGRFNVENLCAAVAAGEALGLAPGQVIAALEGAAQVPGRMEGFRLPGGGGAIVDYAHTPDALAAVLDSCREFCRGRVISVFGCGGDRDRGKRPQMGAASARGADLTWITSDNPRSEDPAAICAAILDGFQEADGAVTSVRVEPDRRRAIAGALAEAEDGDLVVVAGKGHEDYQIVGERRLDLDDRALIREWIREQGGAS